MTRFFDEPAETASRDELAAKQLAGLKRTVQHVYQNNAVYRAKFDEAGVQPGDVKSLDDVSALPCVTKEDLRIHYPLAMCCVPRKTLAEFHMSSGSTGSPIVMPYTLGDLDQWAQCMARCYVMAGMAPSDVVQITPSFGLFNGGFGMYHGARKVGLFIVPTGAGNTKRQLQLARDFGTKCLTGVVSYGLRVMEVAQEEGIDLPDLTVGIFGAESFSESMREKVNNGLGIEAFDIYGMTETGGVGTTGMDCPAHDGIHVWEDHYITEVIHPQTGRPVPDGEIGELVFTAITREALPVVRFRTGDASRVVSRERCGCGRTHLKIDYVTGRLDDMIIVKGVNFFPRQVEQVLMSIPGVKSHYQIIIDEKDGLRDVTIYVEADAHVTGFVVEKALKEALGFSPKGEVFKPGELARTEGKAQRIVRRNGE